jgi:hypothetical protein
MTVLLSVLIVIVAIDVILRIREANARLDALLDIRHADQEGEVERQNQSLG